MKSTTIQFNEVGSDEDSVIAAISIIIISAQAQTTRLVIKIPLTKTKSKNILERSS